MPRVFRDDRFDTEDALWFDGVVQAAEEGRNYIYGTAGDDRLLGTSGLDVFNMGQGGNDVVLGGRWNDRIFFEDSFTDADTVIGGDGYDALYLRGTSDPELVLGPDNLRGVEIIKLIGNILDYDMTLLDGMGDLRIRSVNGGAFAANIDASSVTTGRLNIFAGLGPERIIGGAKNDIITGVWGADVLTGGDGADTFKYVSIPDSRERPDRSSVDLITDFQKNDRIRLALSSHLDVSYHVGATADRKGDIIISYDELSDITRLGIYVNADDMEDMAISLSGDFLGFEVVNYDLIVLI